MLLDGLQWMWGNLQYIVLDSAITVSHWAFLKVENNWKVQLTALPHIGILTGKKHVLDLAIWSWSMPLDLLDHTQCVHCNHQWVYNSWHKSHRRSILAYKYLQCANLTRIFVTYRSATSIASWSDAVCQMSSFMTNTWTNTSNFKGVTYFVFRCKAQSYCNGPRHSETNCLLAVWCLSRWGYASGKNYNIYAQIAVNSKLISMLYKGIWDRAIRNKFSHAHDKCWKYSKL